MEISKAELSGRGNMLRNYSVEVSFMGIAMTPEKIHVGFRSENHLETIEEIIGQKWAGTAEIGTISEARGKFEAGVGTPQSARDH